MGGGIKEFDIARTGKKLVIQELENMSDPQTGRILTGSWVWDSSVLLSEWITNQRQNEFDLQGKTVLELGAGMGIPGMTAALLGASHVVLTDVESLITGLQNNVDINSLGDRVKVGELVWGSQESWSSLVGNIPELNHKIDLVLMSDVFYDITSMPELGRTLKWIVKSDETSLQTRVWCATEIRQWTSQCLYELMKDGFSVIELTNQLNPPSLMSSSSLMDDDCDENQPSYAIYQIVPTI